MFFNKQKVNKEIDELIKVAALLIHAAKIDEEYTIQEEEIITKALLKFGATTNSVKKIIEDGKKVEKNSNQILEFTKEVKKALEGVQLPIAGFRGSGMAWMVDILSGVLTGGNHAGRVKDPFDDFSGPQNIGHLFITFKTNLFVKNFNNRIKDNIKTIKKLPKINGIKEIMYPGENKFKRHKENQKKEINITEITKKDLEFLSR